MYYNKRKVNYKQNIELFLSIITKLSQYIDIQSSIVNKDTFNLINRTINLSDVTFHVLIDNCAINTPSSQSKRDKFNSICIKGKYGKLLEFYKDGLIKLQRLKQQNKDLEKEKLERKNKMLNQLSKLSQTQLNKKRKLSQTSTAGQEEQGKTGLNQEQMLKQRISKEKISALQQKLASIKKKNDCKRQEQLRQIQCLKEEHKLLQLSKNSLKFTHAIEVQKVRQECENSQYYKSLQQKKTSLIQRHDQIQRNIQIREKQRIQLCNNIEYIKSTQNCCEQILNDELCSIGYKIQGKRVEYDSNKRYLDKIIRSRKHQQNICFTDIQNQIGYLNDYCQQMMSKKKVVGAQIKKYKQKRLIFMQEMKLGNEKQQNLQKDQIQLDHKIKQQNIIHNQLQDQYFSHLQKIDLKLQENKMTIHPQQQIKILKQKKGVLQEQIKEIKTQYNQQKSYIDLNQNLIPLNIVKDLEKKVKHRKQQINQLYDLRKENEVLQKSNQKLSEDKQRLQWRSNPQIQKLCLQQKQLLSGQKMVSQQIKMLKKQNELLQEKLQNHKESETTKSQQTQIQTAQQRKKQQISDREQKQRIELQAQQLARENRQKLMQRFRANKQKQQEKNEANEMQNKSNQHQNNKIADRQHKSKRTKNASENRNLKEKVEVDKRLKAFFSIRENPLDILRSDFPVNRSQELSRNRSLLQSNPALYMFLVFLIVVVPGLCLGYAL